MSTLLTELEAAWTAIAEEWQEAEKMRSDAVQRLYQYINEEPEDKPSWWNEEYKADPQGALLCLLMTGVSEPGVVKWFTEKFVTVVCFSNADF